MFGAVRNTTQRRIRTCSHTRLMNGCVLYMPLRAMHAPIVSPVMESVFYDVRDWRVFVSYSPCVSHQMMVNSFKNVQEQSSCEPQCAQTFAPIAWSQLF